MLHVVLSTAQDAVMVTRTMTVTRKGQVTIPIDIRRSLNLKEDDRVAVEQHEDAILLRRATSVAEQTAGILAKYRLATPLSAEEERARFKQAVADEVSATHTKMGGIPDLARIEP
jgi:AbrB family looped-hinge helix DNA binding protein